MTAHCFSITKIMCVGPQKHVSPSLIFVSSLPSQCSLTHRLGEFGSKRHLLFKWLSLLGVEHDKLKLGKVSHWRTACGCNVLSVFQTTVDLAGIDVFNSVQVLVKGCTCQISEIQLEIWENTDLWISEFSQYLEMKISAQDRTNNPKIVRFWG